MKIAATQPSLQAAFCEAFFAKKVALKQQFLEKRQAHLFLQGNSLAVDELICQLWRLNQLDTYASLMAIGGYGRQHVFPYSDIDILILIQEDLTENEMATFDAALSPFLIALWNTGLTVAHSVRTLSMAIQDAQTDLDFETSLLEMRLLSDERLYFFDLKAATNQQRNIEAFLNKKQAEQQQKHHKYKHNLEPNIKESAGGLRDLHHLLWFSLAINAGENWTALAAAKLVTLPEKRMLIWAENRLMQMRIALHFCACRAEDKLLFDVQQSVAVLLGFSDKEYVRASEQLMKQYYRVSLTVYQLGQILRGNLRAHFCCPMPSMVCQLDAHFYSVGNVLAAFNPAIFTKKPALIFKAVEHLQHQPELIGLAPRTLRGFWHAQHQIHADFRAQATHQEAFLALVRHPKAAKSLRILHSYGILGRYLPDFGLITGQMQHDLFHIYTVDEHTLTVIDSLYELASPKNRDISPLLNQLHAEFEQPYVLILAALFHDIAKGQGGQHAKKGALLAQKFVETHRVPKADADLIVWLVREHLHFSLVAQKQDLSDPQVIADFAQEMGNPHRLTALYLLTVSDIIGTSPNLWTAWKAQLFEELYRITLAHLCGGTPHVLSKKNALLAQPLHHSIRTWLQAQPDAYFLRQTQNDILIQALLASRMASNQVNANGRQHEIYLKKNTLTNSLQIFLCTADQPALFAHICQFFESSNYNILTAIIDTTAEGLALDTFHLSFENKHLEKWTDQDLEKLTHEFAQYLTLAGTQNQPLPKRINRRGNNRHLKHFPITPQVTITPDTRPNYWRLSLIAGDKAGLLADIAWVFAAANLNVHLAKIMTLGSRVEDSFIINAPFSKDDAAIIELQNKLILALS
ncbi:MAG: [protein-PII] uridylyltransferase [Neisseriaceae bacterium]|nr:[protein-PII] uridylyltransferase [Neisseriaceae bacterium]